MTKNFDNLQIGTVILPHFETQSTEGIISVDRSELISEKKSLVNLKRASQIIQRKSFLASLGE